MIDQSINHNLLQFHCTAGLQGPQSRYLFAICCIDLHKLTEAESALLPDNDISRVPNGAAGYYLLGRVFQLSNRHNVAIAYYNTALKLDPMMWCALEELCVLGADHEAAEYLNTDASLEQQQQGSFPGAAGAFDPSTALRQQQQPVGFTFATHHTPLGQLAAIGGGGGGSMTVGHTPTIIPRMTAAEHASAGNVGEYFDFTTPEAADVLSGPPAIVGRGGGAPAWPPSTAGALPSASTPTMLPGWQQIGGCGGSGSSMPHHQQQQQQQRKFMDEGKMRKISSKLFADPASVLRQMTVMTTGGAAAGVNGGIGNQQQQQQQQQQHRFLYSAEDAAALVNTAAVCGVPRGDRSVEGQAAAVSLLQLVGDGFRLLCMYKSQEAVEAFTRLPPKHLHTGWALMQLGRAYFEMVNYHSAALAFEQARKVDPYRLTGVEVYSTVLWHMKREIDLSALAQEAIALDRHSPAAWCVMGNCFSLQKEHESALRFFQRALQLDSTLPYAYTLCGHEYFANEDFEKGITCYRNAIRIDPRHYNAWFGMGHIYYRQEKYGMAEYHFRRAHGINDRSSVLRCYLGMALHKLNRSAEALEALSAAIAADPQNPLARFERATVLAADGRLEQALDELLALHDVAPREASVLFHMGKVLKRMGRIQDALAAFSEALDLQPPSADTNLIKSAIDRVTQPDAEEEEEV